MISENIRERSGESFRVLSNQGSNLYKKSFFFTGKHKIACFAIAVKLLDKVGI